MEELTRKCDRLSLSAKEGEKLSLPKKLSKTDHVLAAKFLTKRNLNIEAVARTFRPLGRTRESFGVTNAGNNVLLFEFDLEVDAEKVLQGEPWSFDMHLVILPRFDGSKSVKELEFRFYSFWVQIHDLPFKFMTPETAKFIGATVGPVIKSNDPTELKGGTFMRVRIRVDITQPLCRGRKIVFDEKEEGWVAFQYERLPNLCFWCGMLSHDDKDCEIWLKSKGSLPVEQQQYGHWIRASQFSPVCRQYVEVKGYESRGPQTLSKGRQQELRDQMENVEVQPLLTGTMETGEVELVRSCGTECITEGLGPSRGESELGVTKTLADGSDFKAMIEEIDKGIRNEGAVADQVVTEILKEIQGSGKALLVEGEAHGDTPVQALVEEGLKDYNGNILGVEDIGFKIGWSEPKNKNKGLKKPKDKGEGAVVNDGKEGHGLAQNREVRKGSWTRLTTRLVGNEDQIMSENEVGSRRKNVMGNKMENEMIGKEKRLKLEEEAKALGSLFATHLGAVEVAKHPVEPNESIKLELSRTWEPSDN